MWSIVFLNTIEKLHGIKLLFIIPILERSSSKIVHVKNGYFFISSAKWKLSSINFCFINRQLKLACHLFRTYKWKWLLFIRLAYDMLPFQLVGVIISQAFNFDGLAQSCVNSMYYYFYSTANSESKDSFSVFLDREFDVSLGKVDR